jgi:bacterioferritin
MKGNNIVLQHLQKALSMELTAVNQYFLHAHTLDDWGYPKLAASMREEMGEEQGHASRLIDRMLFLEGTPDVQNLDKINYPKSVRDMFQTDLDDEYEARTYYTKAAIDCRDAGDLGTHEIFISLLQDEEGHIDHLEKQLRLIEQLTEPLYLQMHASPDGEKGGDGG